MESSGHLLWERKPLLFETSGVFYCNINNVIDFYLPCFLLLSHAFLFWKVTDTTGSLLDFFFFYRMLVFLLGLFCANKFQTNENNLTKMLFLHIFTGSLQSNWDLIWCAFLFSLPFCSVTTDKSGLAGKFIVNIVNFSYELHWLIICPCCHIRAEYHNILILFKAH